MGGSEDPNLNCASSGQLGLRLLGMRMWSVPQVGGTILGVPKKRIVQCWEMYWSPYLGNNHVGLRVLMTHLLS